MTIEVISLIGVIVAIIFMVWSIYRGLGLPLASVLGTAIIIGTSGMNFSQAWDTAMNSGVSAMLGTFSMVFLFGGILGLFYAESGAAASLGEAILSVTNKVKNPNVKRIVALTLFIVFRLLLTIAGVDGMACIVPTVALCVTLFQELDIPRRYMNAFLITGCTVSLFMPFVPCGPNIMMPILVPGFTAATGWQARIACVVIMSIAVVLVLNVMVGRVQAKGEHFEIGRLGAFQIPKDQKKPHWLLTMLPIIVVFVLYNVVNLSAWIALACGTIVSILAFAPYIKIPEGPQGMPAGPGAPPAGSVPGGMEPPKKSKFAFLVDKCNQGSTMISLYMSLSFLPGAAIGIVPAYNLITAGCNQLTAWTSGIVAFTILSVVLTLVGGSNTIILAGLMNAVFLPGGLTMAQCAAVMFVGCSVLSGLPNSMYVCSQAEMTDCTLKECYGPVFLSNVLLPAIITVFALVMVMIGIW